MAIKKILKKEPDQEVNVNKKEIEKNEIEKNQHYFYAVGRRKTAVARVKIFPKKKSGFSLLINGKKNEDFFSIKRLIPLAESPLTLMGEKNGFDVEVKVSGGGINAQAEAVRLAIARALVVFDKDFKKILKAQGFLTRDSRKVERKKPGLKKARKSPQWAKR